MIAIVTATTDKLRAWPCLASWFEHAHGRTPVVVVRNGTKSRNHLGVIPAFKRGMDICWVRHTTDPIACFHDDLVILEHDWDRQVVQVFRDHPEVGLIGFAGVQGIGTDALYHEPYAIEQLAGQGYKSSRVDAEAYGARSRVIEPVAGLDGFALIGRRAFWEGLPYAVWRERTGGTGALVTKSRRGWRPDPFSDEPGPWAYLDEKGFMNHFYGAALGCLARRLGWSVYIVPIRCRHLGGITTRAADYQQWAETVIPGGDRGFCEAAHRIGYYLFKDVLPLRVAAPA